LIGRTCIQPQKRGWKVISWPRKRVVDWPHYLERSEKNCLKTADNAVDMPYG
jgi:hypothetical protein